VRPSPAAALLVLALAACAPLERPPPAPASPSGVDAAMRARYDDLARAGHPVYAVEASRSIVVIEVRRSGTLANLGHDHVVSSTALAGYVAPAQGDADVVLPLRTLVVDDPPLRRAAGFDTQPSASDVEGTRANMLGKVLRVDEHPYAIVRLRGMHAAHGPAAVDASVTLNRTTRPLRAELRIDDTGGMIRVAGTLQLRQTDFGVVPYSVLGGAIQVRDALDVRFDIVARPI